MASSSSQTLSVEQKNRMIDVYLKQCKDFDKDQRYMATSDMAVFLQQQDFKLDSHRERDVCEAILKQFDDSSIDVQSIAVRTVPLLVAKVQQQQVVEICAQLCEKMLTGDESVRNLYAIGLKTCVSNLPETHAHLVLARVVPKLTSFIERDTSSAAVQDALEVMNDVLARFGAMMETAHDPIIKMAIAQLSNPNNLVRKRAIGCLGAVSAVAMDASLNRMVETILGRIDGKAGSKDSVTQETIFVQSIGAIGRASGNRLGQHVDRIVPLLFRHLKSGQDESMQNTAGDDHRENIFQGLESFVLRCPNEMQPHLEQVLGKTSEFLMYDPNFNYGDEDEEEMDAGGSEEEDDDYSNFGDEDDDTSWKVRRAAAKVLNSIIVSRPDALSAYYARVQDLLQKRFQERVESVRLDILEAYKSLLEATGAGQDAASLGKDKPVLVRQRSTMDLLLQNLTPVVKSLSKLMREKSRHAIKTKIMAFQVASRLVAVLNGSLDDIQLDGLLQPTVPCLSDKNSTLRLEALLLCKALLLKVPRIPLSKCDQLKQPLVKCIQAEWFRIVSEALKCVAGLCRSVRPQEEGMFVEGGASDKDLDQWGAALCDAVSPRLKQHDIDQEIKNSAIEATGVVLAVFGNHVGPDRQKEALQLLLERTKNESSRLFALRALERCARSPARLSFFSTVAPPAAEELAVLLRQQSREIRQHALSTYMAMVDVAEYVPSKANLDQVAQELGVLIVDSKDSTLAHLALVMSSILIAKLGQNGKQAVRDKVAQSVVQMTCTSASLLTGQAYLSLMELYRTMAAQGQDAGLGFDDLFARLFPAANDSYFEHLPKNVVPIVAEACAVITCNCPDAAKRDGTIQMALSLASGDASRKDKALATKRLVALIMLGEIGRRASLGAVKTPSTVDAVLRSAFRDEDEGVKVAAASSLGKLVVGDPQSFLPVVMTALEAKTGGNNHYLVLVSLREVLSSENASAHVSARLDTVVSVLSTHCSDANEEVRNMVAECLGKLAVLFPSSVVPQFASSASDSPEVRWSKITATRYAIVALGSSSRAAGDAKERIFAAFKSAVCPHLGDKDNLEVSKAALMAAHALVHHAPEMALALFPHGQGLVEVVYASTEVREELQKKVDFGPFKVTVDDGLPLRKSAFSCLSAMLENAPDLLGSVSGQLLPVVARGLDDSPEDAPDIPFVCHQILLQLCARYPVAVLAQSAALMKQFQKTLKLKLDAKDQEKLERRTSVIKSAIRTLDQICALNGALEDRDVGETIAVIQKTDYLKQMAMDDALKNVFKRASEVAASSAS